MSSDPLNPDENLQADYHARWEAVETVKAQELAAMTEERARQIIRSLGAVEGWRERSDWSGLVEQRAADWILSTSAAKQAKDYLHTRRFCP